MVMFQAWHKGRARSGKEELYDKLSAGAFFSMAEKTDGNPTETDCLVDGMGTSRSVFAPL